MISGIDQCRFRRVFVVCNVKKVSLSISQTKVFFVTMVVSQFIAKSVH